MDWGQQINRNRMLTGQRESAIAVVKQCASQHSRVSAEGRPIQARLNRSFPNADDAECQIVLRIRDKLAGRSGKAMRFPCGPQKQMRIEQEFHFVSSSSSP